MDLEKGKQIFWEFSGNRFHIDREEYKKCEVPKNTEQQWLNEIKIDLLSKIKVSKGSDQVVWISLYSVLGYRISHRFFDCGSKAKRLGYFLYDHPIGKIKTTFVLRSFRSDSEKNKEHISVR